MTPTVTSPRRTKAERLAEENQQRREESAAALVESAIGDAPAMADQESNPKTRTFMDGDAWCTVGPGFTNLQESPAGFGASPEESKVEFAKAFKALHSERPKSEASKDEHDVFNWACKLLASINAIVDSTDHDDPGPVPDPRPRRQLTKNLPVKLTDLELLEIARRSANETQELARVTDAKKEAAQQYKLKEESCNARIKQYANLIRSGFEYRDVECEQVTNYDRGEAITYRIDTGELVELRPLTVSERQTKLDLDEEVKRAKAPEKAPDGKVQIGDKFVDEDGVVHIFQGAREDDVLAFLVGEETRLLTEEAAEEMLTPYTGEFDETGSPFPVINEEGA